MTALFSVLTILSGVFMFVFGGMDDSPGAQLLGVIAVAVGIYAAVRNRKSK